MTTGKAMEEHTVTTFMRQYSLTKRKQSLKNLIRHQITRLDRITNTKMGSHLQCKKIVLWTSTWLHHNSLQDK